MSSNDAEYFNNYKPNTLYVGKETEAGKYVNFVIDISKEIRLALSLFYVNEKDDTRTCKITKLRNGKEEQSITFSAMSLDKIDAFLSELRNIDLSQTSSERIQFAPRVDINIEMLKQIFEKNADLEDIYAIAEKRRALNTFEQMLSNDQMNEPAWQAFFESNEWIFGHGLSYVFVDKVSNKLEQNVKGADFNAPGKRVDALMKTKAEISQYVLVEIKKASTDLLDKQPYRSGCWPASDELIGAVTQIQKTSYDFVQHRFKDDIRNSAGDLTGESVYAIRPKSYLVIGRLKELAENNDKLISFELFRKSISSPEIITFDELFERAKCIVGNISHKNDAKILSTDTNTEPLTGDDEDFPF